MVQPSQKRTKSEEHIGVTRFRDYLRINTMQPTPKYKECAAFLKEYALELGLECQLVEASEH
jgi:hypothetical protein